MNTTLNATDRLIEKTELMQNPTVVGLDPDLSFVPDFLKKRCRDKYEKEYGKGQGMELKAMADAVLEFNKSLIDALADIIPAVKPQSAFYEALGADGVYAFAETVKYAKERGLFVIADVKRGDIGSTAAAYAEGFLGEKAFNADSVTVNPYLGYDGVKPFIDACDICNKSIFVLVKTSNPSSGELQDLISNGKPIYEIVGQMCAEWGKDRIGKHGYSSVCAVVGATYPKQLQSLRKMLPNTFFLIPGYGVQGGTAADLAGAFDSNWRGGIVNSSRGIIAAYKREGCDERDFAGAARREAERMREDLMGVLL